jgi:lipopolysaccharide biosynthesis glycosyltransferase
MEIVTCFNHDFVMPTGVMMYSLCKNNKEVEVNFHLLVDESVTEEDRNDLLYTVSEFKKKTIVFYTLNSSSFSDFPATPSHIMSNSAYYRLFVADILPKAIDKILYLDGDVIVRQSLLPLWNTDISEFAAATVCEKPYQMTSAFGNYFDRLGYASQLGYFNSGVMLINLDFWRSNSISKQLIDFLNEYPERVKICDQDALNYVLRESKLGLPPKYNFQSSFFYTKCFSKAISEEDVREAIENPVIVHFIGEKPWCRKSLYPHPYRSTFIKYQNETKWKGLRIDRRPMKLKVINTVADMLRLLRLKAKWYVNIKPID